MEASEPLRRSDVPFVFVAISNICNLNCAMCETQNASVPKGNMSFELFRRVVEDLKRMGVKGIALHNVNEPILHPRIVDFLNHLEDSRLHVFLSSNGQTLDRFIERARSQPRLPRRLVFRYSIDGGTKETYEEMRRGGDFEKIIANLALMQDFCDERGIRYVPSCNYILTAKTAGEVGTYYRLFRRFFALENISFCFLHGHPVFGVTDFIRANALTPLALTLPCRTPFETMSVHHDGKVSLCCIDYNQEGIVGNCPADALDSIWNGEKMEEYRRAHNEGDVQALPPLCRRCVYSTQIELYGRINSTIRELLSHEERDKRAVNEEIYDFVIGLTTAQLA